MKRTSKIAIRRQTLRSLSTEATKAVAGGAMTHHWKCTGDTDVSHGPTCGNATVCVSMLHC
jgi:hypothetical protein